ncbi:hypothetical protein D3C80_1935210 [compost metagenome]
MRPASVASVGPAALASPRSFQPGLSEQLTTWKLSAAEDARPSQNRWRLEVFFLEEGEALLRLLAVRVLFVMSAGMLTPKHRAPGQAQGPWPRIHSRVRC